LSAAAAAAVWFSATIVVVATSDVQDLREIEQKKKRARAHATAHARYISPVRGF
jgi:hypothetical protein